MTHVAVEPQVLEWARVRGGHDEASIRHRFRQWDRWVTQQTQPTIRQAQAIADFTHVPFGMLFLPTPPKTELPIPDFRVTGPGMEEPSQDLLETIYLNQRRQDWFEEYLRTWSEEPADLPGTARGMSIDAAARLIGSELGYGIGDRAGIATFDAARRHLARAFEARGGLVVMSSMVGNNTHRMLDREEFRGFTLQSKTAPLVFVNTNDTKSGQIFSLLHEFAHAWHGDSGVSVGGEPLLEAETEIERWCDAVAAEIAAPRNDLVARFQPGAPLTEELDRLAKLYKCSTLVVLIRLRDLELVPTLGFEDVYGAEVARLMELIEGQPTASGGDFYNNQPFRIGERLSHALITDTRRGTTSMTEALSLMSLGSSDVFDKYAGRLALS